MDVSACSLLLCVVKQIKIFTIKYLLSFYFLQRICLMDEFVSKLMFTLNFSTTAKPLSHYINVWLNLLSHIAM